MSKDEYLSSQVEAIVFMILSLKDFSHHAGSFVKVRKYHSKILQF